MRKQEGIVPAINTASKDALRLPEVLDGENLLSLREQILAALNSADVVSLDTDGVDGINTKVVQFLIAAQKYASSLNKKITIVNASTTFENAFTELGVGAEFAQWSK
jgi:anti-anti-sigma regulatory factor